MTRLERLAERAGVQVYWRDAFGKARRVAPRTLRAIVEAVGPPDSRPAPLLTAPLRRAIDVTPLGRALRAFRVDLEDGRRFAGHTREQGGRVWLPALPQPGYHRLQLGASMR